MWTDIQNSEFYQIPGQVSERFGDVVVYKVDYTSTRTQEFVACKGTRA